MKPIHTIRTLEQLRALANPLRVEILNQITAQPLTVVQIAARLKHAPTKLYFHITELERTGLVEVAGTQSRGNLIERHYRAAAEHFVVDKGLFREHGVAGLTAFSQSIGAVLDRTGVDLQKAIASKRVSVAEAGQAKAVYTDLRLPPTRLTEFSRRLDALLDDFAAPETEAETAKLTLVFYRLTDPQETDNEA